MKKNEISLLPSYWASVSGGKDSFYMLKLILSNLEKYPLNGVIHFELEIDMPVVKGVIDYMEAECKKFNIPFIRVKPTLSWEELYNKYHFPTRQSRWCNSKYKLSAKTEFNKHMKNLGYNVIYYIGYCFDEKKRYATRSVLNERYPLVENNICESTILNWARNCSIFNDYYIFNKRLGCYLCPMISLPNMAYLYKYYPNEYKYLIDKMLDSEKFFTNRNKKPFYFRNNYSVNYIDKIVKTKYIPLLESSLNKFQLSFFEVHNV